MRNSFWYLKQVMKQQNEHNVKRHQIETTDNCLKCSGYQGSHLMPNIFPKLMFDGMKISGMILIDEMQWQQSYGKQQINYDFRYIRPIHLCCSYKFGIVFVTLTLSDENELEPANNTGEDEVIVVHPERQPMPSFIRIIYTET